MEVYVTPLNDDGEEIEDDAETITVTIDPDEPECEGGEDHDWRSPHSVLGGIKENPGVWGHGGGAIIKEVCACCGRYKITDTWAQNPENGEQGLTSVEYQDADDDSIAWLMRHLNLPESIDIKGVEVALEWDKTADIRQDDDAVGTAVHQVDESELDDGTADGPCDGEVFEIDGVKFKLGSHDYDTDEGRITCSANIYRVL